MKDASLADWRKSSDLQSYYQGITASWTKCDSFLPLSLREPDTWEQKWRRPGCKNSCHSSQLHSDQSDLEEPRYSRRRLASRGDLRQVAAVRTWTQERAEELARMAASATASASAASEESAERTAVLTGVVKDGLARPAAPGGAAHPDTARSRTPPDDREAESARIDSCILHAGVPGERHVLG